MGSKITRRWLLRCLASAGVIAAGVPLALKGAASAESGAGTSDVNTSNVRVLWFNRERGFGFIEIDGQDRFVHLESLQRYRSKQKIA